MVESEWTTTDAAGRYRFSSLPAGEFHLTAVTDGWVAGDLDKLAVKAGEVAQAEDVVMTRGAIARVKLLDAKTGAPLAFEQATKGYIHPLSAEEPSRMYHGSRIATFSKEGVGELRIPAGKYHFFANVPAGESGVRGDWQTANATPQAAKVFDVAEGQTVEVTLRMEPLTEQVYATVVPAVPPSERGDGNADKSSSVPAPSKGE
jgi:hypothetical protein